MGSCAVLVCLMVNGWETYVIGQNGFVGRGGIAKGGIYGRKDGRTWASLRLGASAEQLQSLNALFNDPSSGYTKGFHIEDQRFTLLRIDVQDGFLQGRSTGGDGEQRSITVVRTQKALLLAVSEPNANAGTISVTLGKVVDYIRERGF